MAMTENTEKTFGEFVSVVERLRRECPWDRVQTHESLKEYMLNETREVMDGIDLLSSEGDGSNLCEELGDVLFLLILQCVIAEEEGLFTLEQVLSGVSSKMKFRHPRIFSPDHPELASLSWEELKRREKSGGSGEKPEKSGKTADGRGRRRLVK